MPLRPEWLDEVARGTPNADEEKGMAMRTTTLGSSGPEVGVIGFGCMGLTA